MTIPVKIKYSVLGGTVQVPGRQYQLIVGPAEANYAALNNIPYTQNFYVGSPEDVPNNVFLTIEDGLDNFLQTMIDGVIGEINTQLSSSDYVQGDVYTDTIVNLSAIKIAPDVMDMLGDSSGLSGAASKIADSLELETAAFHPASDFATAVHTHVANDITNATTVGKNVLTASTQANARTAIGAGTSNVSLPIAESDVTNLVSDLAGKVSTSTTVNGHALSSNVTVTKSDVGLGNVDNTADSAKALAASQITSGTFSDSRIAQSNVTQHQAALAIASTQVTGTKTSSYISDFNEAAQDAVGGIMSGSNGVIVTYNDAANTITVAGSSRTFNNPTRSLNSAFQISTTQDTAVSYSVDIAASLSLTGGQAGTVYLRYADDSAHTTNVKEVCRFAASNTGTLTIGLALNQIATGTLSGIIPASKYAKMVTNNDTGTPTFTYRNAQEVLL